MSLTKVTSDVLEARYTNAAVISGTSGTLSVDWSAAAIYNMANDLTGAATLNFTGFVTGQVLTIYALEGAQTLTLSSDAVSGSTFYKIGADYDGSSSPNILQVECLNDSANAVFVYTVATSTQDTTP
jgi:hypothetical protein|tara:strand:+ start:96 stop:476 length:381 start_codon:yes stop_codon:yes gene_type:complete